MELALYLRWLRSKGVAMGFDELVMDNLRCVFESRPTDVDEEKAHGLAGRVRERPPPREGLFGSQEEPGD